MAIIREKYTRNGETILEHTYNITGKVSTHYVPAPIADNTADWQRVMRQDGCEIVSYDTGIWHVHEARNDSRGEVSYLSIM